MRAIRRDMAGGFLKLLFAAAISLPSLLSPSLAGAAEAPAATSSPAYADLADLADSAQLVVRAQVRKISRVEDERAPGLRPGWARYYVEARTQALLTGRSAQGETLVYLADVPLDARGKPPKIKKQDVLLFARPARGRPGELQLVSPDAQILWSPAIEAKLRPILTELVAADAPGKVSGVREIIHVPGNLAGAGETQIFLSTEDGSAASITVQHQPGSPPAWGASFSELIAEVGNPPKRDTLAWYRLACFLPQTPLPTANLSETATSRAQAEADYRMVLDQLGPCGRTRK